MTTENNLYLAITLLNQLLTQLTNNLLLINTKADTIMADQAEATVALEAVNANLVANIAKLDEAIAELSGLPTIVADQAAHIAYLAAQLLAAGNGTITPELQAAIDSLAATNVQFDEKATALANIVV